MRIGILGGSFSPLHSGHITIIDLAFKKLKLDKVLLLPTFNPPHKEASDDYEHRVNMLRLFASSRSGVVVDETEKELGLEKSYAYLVLEAVTEKYPSNTEFFYLLGSDSIRRFNVWARPGRIMQLVDLATVLRGDDDLTDVLNALKERYGKRVNVIGRANDESSSLLKLDLELGRYDRLEGRVPTEIIEYIRENGLYRRYSHIVERLKETLSERTFNHSVRVAEYAVTHAWEVWENFESTFLAGLLHDCAKGMAPIKPLSEYPIENEDGLEIIHQFDGATVAREEYGVTDERVLDAIRYHTTSKGNASPLLKLIYCADKIELGRRYEGVERLREIFEEDFERGYLETLLHGVEYLKGTNKWISPLTKEALGGII